MAQADFVASRLRAHAPDVHVELVGITSQGDRDTSPSLAAAGGKNSFVGALEDALDDGRADLAVHSMKDVGAVVAEGSSVDAPPAVGEGCSVAPPPVVVCEPVAVGSGAGSLPQATMATAIAEIVRARITFLRRFVFFIVSLG